MPLKKDDSGRRWVEMEFLVPGTPEQVWHAIATGPGMSSWFTPTKVDEHVGGAIAFDFGDETAARISHRERSRRGIRRFASRTRNTGGAARRRL
jgi:uncharacterized protein YndB with AHSA1/START domain